MKKLVLFTLGIGLGLFSMAQTDVALKINHKLGTEPFALETTVTSEAGADFQVTRLEYYLTKFTVIHDGGQAMELGLDVLALVNPGEEASTTIPLGNLDVTEVEAIKFHIGVYEPINNEDPSLQPMGHPLAPKSPSMHWGWAAGYRFVAYEGVGGADMTTVFQLHGLGNDNYFETSAVVTTETIDDVLTLNIDADYLEAIRGISVGTGVFSHGETGDAKLTLENFRDYVFGAQYVSIEEAPQNDLTWKIFPNPSASETVTINYPTQGGQYQFTVTNSIGQVIRQITTDSAENGTVSLTLPGRGVYLVTAIENGQILRTERLIIQ